MERIVEAGKEIVDRHRKALVVICTVAAMIVVPFIVGTPKTAETHRYSGCWNESLCNWTCILTGHSGGSCNNNDCQCNH